MTRFVVGDDRSQSTLFPERLADYLSEDNPVRNDGSHVGSTKPPLRPCKRGSIETRPKCASVARPSSIRSVR